MLLPHSNPRREHLSIRTICALLVLFCTTTVLKAQSGTSVQYKSGDESVSALLFTPHSQPVQGKLPAIVVIHEWWGLNDWVKEQAQKFADQGYVTLAIDLYRGKVATNPDEAHQLMRGVPDDRADRDLKAATAYLRSRKDVDPKRVGSIGWCMGGGYSEKLTELDPQLKAAVINYGKVPADAATLKPVHAAVLGIFGGQDQGITVDSVKAWEAKMKQLGKSVQVIIYPDTGHAFENPNNKTGYNEKDAQDAYAHQTEFFANHLKK
jgi:carboxymethylenebutenolidase